MLMRTQVGKQIKPGLGSKKPRPKPKPKPKPKSW